MSISSARLSAHYCCICLLLFITSVTSETAARTTPSVSANKVPDITHLDSNKAKCKYNLTDSGHLLEANSPIHPLHSFSQCEYIIQAPSSHFILLNFTENYSQSDMPVQPSVRSQHFQQEATHTTTTKTTPPTESILPKAHLRAPKSGEEDSQNTTVQQSQSSSESVPTALDQVGDLDYRQHKKSHNTVTTSDRYGDKRKTQPGDHKSSLDNSVQEQALSKETLKKTSFSGKDSTILPGVEKGSHLELNSSDTEGGLILPTRNCSLKLIIEEVNDTSGSGPQVICWGRTWQHRIPIVFQYTVPIRITYVWDGHRQNGFFLDVSFLRPEEVDCLFRCNNHLCLPRKHLCDGNIDCPDHSDELNSACILDDKDNGDPHIVKVIIIIISVIIGIGLTLFLVFTINYIRCRNSARRGGGSLLQPPYSQSSEVCHSTTDSIQESGQCETLLSQHPPRQAVLPALRATSSHFLEHQQLLQHQRYQPEFEQQQCRYHTSRKHCLNQYHQMSQEHQIRSISSSAAGALPPDSNRRIHKCLQQKHVHHQQKLPDQHVQQLRPHRQANKHANPDELYPPNIPLSADGEEGYVMSQRALHCKQQLERNWQVENEMFRPPPNKTVFDRDSPPPPYSLNLPGAKSLDSLIPPLSVTCVLRPTRSSLMAPSSPPAVPRSQSLSCHH